MPKEITEYPKALDAEDHLLSTLLIEPLLIESIDLAVDDFYSYPNRYIYEAIRTVYTKNKSADIVLVKDELKRKRKYREAGGASRLAQLMEVFSLATKENVNGHVNLIKEKAIRRKIIDLSSKIMFCANEENEFGRVYQLIDILKDAAINTNQVQKPYVWLSEKIVECSEMIENMVKGNESAIGAKTGFLDIDSLIGGLKRGNLIIVAGRPGEGKTSLAANIAMNIATIERPVLVVALEQGALEVTLRIVIQDSKIDSKRLLNGKLSPYDWDLLRKTLCKLSKVNKVCIDDGFDVSPYDIAHKARCLKQERGAIGAIIIDYLQLMRPNSKSENRTNDISSISRAFKIMAKEFDCPVIALSQLSRAVENRPDKMPQLYDLRDSGSLEQDADIVILIHRPKEEDRKNIALVNIAKQRNGPRGTVKLLFMEESMCFMNLAKGQDND